jgi:CxxC-x17-CxxC domain-containing protein
MSDERRGGFRERRGGFRPSGPRETHKATCADCGKETEVPFKPSGDRPVYCQECYQKHKPKRY